jgi:hypothetical protein
MTSQELHQVAGLNNEVELPAACVACDGPIVVRFTPGSAVGVCLACRRLAPMTVARSAEGLRVVQLPGGLA